MRGDGAHIYDIHGKRYLDGVDFHAYPYNLPSGNGTAAAGTETFSYAVFNPL